MRSQDAGELWDRIQQSIAVNAPPGSFDTWFRPLRALRLDGSVLEVTTPTETFRALFTKNYLDLLLRVVTEVVGSRMEIRLSSREPENSHGEGCVNRAQPFPVVRASELETPVQQQAWLIERLWTHQAVGVIGGSPKNGKTWLALEMAVSIASGSPCLATFPVFSPGPVLLYAAEDSYGELRTRLETLAHLHNIDLDQLDVHIITVDSLRLDLPDHQERLESTVCLHKPILLILDPLVRLHAIDENIAGQVAALLGYLRSLQRKTGTAIALIHHMRKNVSPTAAAGNSLRGSSDIYAWLDSFLYVRMHHGQRTLSAEHRSAPAFGPVVLELIQSDARSAYLKLVSSSEASPEAKYDSLASRILQLLSTTPQPLTVDSLRSRLQVRNQRVVETLRLLVAQGKIQRNARGFTLCLQTILPV